MSAGTRFATRCYRNVLGGCTPGPAAVVGRYSLRIRTSSGDGATSAVVSAARHCVHVPLRVATMKRRESQGHETSDGGVKGGSG
jgi:hypothetical protein